MPVPSFICYSLCSHAALKKKINSFVLLLREEILVILDLLVKSLSPAPSEDYGKILAAFRGSRILPKIRLGKKKTTHQKKKITTKICTSISKECGLISKVYEISAIKFYSPDQQSMLHNWQCIQSLSYCTSLLPDQSSMQLNQ